MGAVYKVLDRRTGRPAALKIILEDGDQPEARQRFLREARLTARLNHPGIPPVYEIGETARSELFLLMRLIEGMTLQELLLEKTKDSAEKHQRRILKILIKVAEALACAHSQGVIHRDLKPANIMIGRFDEVLLMDWGVAKDLRAGRDEKLISAPLSPEELEQTGLTLAGAIVGTPGYMAPEQARGEEIDQRADIYAFGLLLGEALCGQPLVAGESTLVRLVANTEGRHRPLEVLGPRLPRRLYWIVKQCLDPDPDHRTNSITDLIEQLQAYLADNEISGYQPSLIERVQSPVRRRPFLTLCALFFFAALALASTISTIQGRIDSATRTRDQLEEERLSALEAAERSADVLALLNEARRLSSRGITDSLEETLDKAILLSEQSSEVILEAARILVRAGLKEPATTILQKLADTQPPAFEALYELHLIAGYKDRQLSPPFLELIKRARELKIENEYSLFADGSKALAEGKDSMAQALFEKSLQRNQRLVPVLISLSLTRAAQRQARGRQRPPRSRHPRRRARRPRLVQPRQHPRPAKRPLRRALRLRARH
jgi:serine/threonine protein kinase